METLFEKCKNVIFNEMDNRLGDKYYTCDLAGILTEYMVCDGTFTYSTQKAKEILIEWWYDAEQYSDYEEFHFGFRSNPFSNVEKYLVFMVREGCATILSRCEFIDKRWNKKITLNKRNIRTIKQQIEELDDEMDLF